MANELVQLNSANTRLKQTNLDLSRDLGRALRRIKRLSKENKDLVLENSKLKKRLKELEKVNKSE